MTAAPATERVCFELRHGDSLQAGLDFDGYFLGDGKFLSGAANVIFDSGLAYVEVTLEAGIDGRAWVNELPSEILDDPVLSRWFLSDRPCSAAAAG